jgi:hypothetical protein
MILETAKADPESLKSDPSFLPALTAIMELVSGEQLDFWIEEYTKKAAEELAGTEAPPPARGREPES